MMALHPLFAEILGSFGMSERDTYRGWEIRRGRWPEPDWMATGPNYDAWTEGEGEWVDNGERADAPTREALVEEIDDWFALHSDSGSRSESRDASSAARAEGRQSGDSVAGASPVTPPPSENPHAG